MPRPALRSRSLARKKKITPGGRGVIHYEKRRPAKPKCAKCKRPLAGVPRLRPAEMRNLAKTKKRPERIYGGYFCPKCLKEVIKENKLYKAEALK